MPLKPEHYNPAWRNALVVFKGEPGVMRIRQISLAGATVVLEVDLATVGFMFEGDEAEEKPAA